MERCDGWQWLSHATFWPRSWSDQSDGGFNRVNLTWRLRLEPAVAACWTRPSALLVWSTCSGSPRTKCENFFPECDCVDVGAATCVCVRPCARARARVCVFMRMCVSVCERVSTCMCMVLFWLLNCKYSFYIVWAGGGVLITTLR